MCNFHLIVLISPPWTQSQLTLNTGASDLGFMKQIMLSRLKLLRRRKQPQGIAESRGDLQRGGNHMKSFPDS